MSPTDGAPRAGTLLSVNVGMPKDVPWQGRTVFTGVFKDPVRGARRVHRLNVDGDGQGDLAGHGGEQRAVFVYQIGSYRYWEHELGRNDFVYGQFGENFTVAGLADDEVCIGDRYRIGRATFEVSQPRVTCYRVGIRMNDARMPALLVSHHRPGFYFRVLEEGEVQAGDEIIKLSSGPEHMTVAEVDALLYLPGHTHQELLRALRVPALSPGWQGSLRALLSTGPGSGNAGLAASSPPPAWSGFRQLRVNAITRESDSVISIRLEDPTGAPLPEARPGQYLTVRVEPEKGRRPLLRNYSLSGPPGAGYYRVTVKREPGGTVSGYLHTRLAVGERLDTGAPRGTFILDEGQAPVLLISAGIGATPVLSMLQALAQARSDREIWWLHGGRNGLEDPFAKEARTLLASLPGARSHVCYSRPGPDDIDGRDFDTAGRLTTSLLAELAPPTDAEAYLCGPATFMDDISAGLAALGFDASRVHTEPFGPAAGLTPGITATPVRAPHPPAGQPGAGPAISFARSDLTIPWSSEFGSLLELAEACDVLVRWSCRAGVCHTCETRLVAGSVDYLPDPVEPPTDGSVLICCAQPRDDVVLDL
jgi:ferredoxin-NADP reductase/MOSC domain-containing protein YiiM/ferredoxin